VIIRFIASKILYGTVNGHTVNQANIDPVLVPGYSVGPGRYLQFIYPTIIWDQVTT